MRAPVLALLASCAAVHSATPDLVALEKEVGETERAFAKTMADRDHAAFCRLLSDDARFITFDPPLIGKEAVCAAWKRFFEKPAAPFSWEPALVQVLPSGDLAVTKGPVRRADGKQVATFSSIWRREPAGWRIIVDVGCDVCAQ
jgi:ketosteroid isomerase-like protein